MSMLSQILAVLVLLWLLVQRWQKRDMVRLANTIGTIKRLKLPFVGHSYIFLGSDEDRMSVFKMMGREASKSGGITSLWHGSRLYLVLTDPVQAQFVLKNCLEKDDIMKYIRLLTGNGTVFAPVHIWRPRRKIMAPTFSPKNLTQFSRIFSQQSNTMVKRLNDVAGKGAFPIWKYITTYSMDSVCESTLGVKINTQNHTEQPILKAFEEISRLSAMRVCQPWLHSDAIYRLTKFYHRFKTCKFIIHDFVNQSIKEKRLFMHEAKGSERGIKKVGFKTFLELLIESSKGEGGYSDVELKEETLVLVFAGTDTSAIGTAYTALLLARHHHVQDKVYQELKEVFGDSDGPIVAEDLPRLKYLDAVIRESLRMYPPIPVIVRKVTKKVTLPSGVALSKDCNVIINIWGMHRNPKYWGEDTEQFRPERFLDKTLENQTAFMPFSYGPRGCIGYQYAMMSMKTALATLLRQYRLLPATAAADKDEPLRVSYDIMMRHVDQYNVRIESRI